MMGDHDDQLIHLASRRVDQVLVAMMGWVELTYDEPQRHVTASWR
jgi:hypothetical protein